jgi:hypothetical protein
MIKAWPKGTASGLSPPARANPGGGSLGGCGCRGCEPPPPPKASGVGTPEPRARFGGGGPPPGMPPPFAMPGGGGRGGPVGPWIARRPAVRPASRVRTGRQTGFPPTRLAKTRDCIRLTHRPWRHPESSLPGAHLRASRPCPAMPPREQRTAWIPLSSRTGDDHCLLAKCRVDAMDTLPCREAKVTGHDL